MTTSIIVVGVDGSEGSARAVAWAVEYAPRLDAEVLAVHSVPVMPAIPLYGGVGTAVEEPGWLEEMEGHLRNEWCRDLADIPHRCIVERGGAARVLIDVAGREHADLLVVGSRGLGGFTELVLGSVSHQVVHHAPCPVVVVPQSPDGLTSG